MFFENIAKNLTPPSTPVVEAPKDPMFDRLSKVDSSLTREAFDKLKAQNPDAVKAIYDQYAPKDFIGSQITLADGSSATVTGISPFTHSDGFTISTDKGKMSVIGKNFLEKGAIYNADKSQVLSIRPEMLDELEKGNVFTISKDFFNGLPDKNNTGLELSSEFYVFNNPSVSSGFYIDFTDPNTLNERYRDVYVGGMRLSKGENGKLFYAGEKTGSNQATVGFLMGDRAGIKRPFTGSPAGGGFSGSGQTVTQKGSILGDLFGGFGESVAGAVRGVLSNPIAQLGISAFVPGGAGLVAAYNAGAALRTGGIESAIKSYALSSAAQAAGNLAGKAASTALGNASQGIVGQALTGSATGAATGAVGAALSGQDIGKGITSGIIGGAVGGVATGIVGQLFPNVDVAPDNEDIAVDTPDGGGGIDTPDFNSSLTDLANKPSNVPVQQRNSNGFSLQQGVQNFAADFLKNIIGSTLSIGVNSLIGNSRSSNPLTQNPATGSNTVGNNTGANMADYAGLIGNILGQNTQINRLEETANQLGGQYQNAAANLNKPFTPYNVTSGAGSTTVEGQNINSQLSQPQQQLANVAGQAAGMFGDVNIPGVEGIRNSALTGAQGLLSRAQGFDPQQAAAQEFAALQQLYAPQRERDRMELENRLLAQGRLGASDNPALRQLEESFRQQDLQGAIQSRNLGFERQQQLQNMAQGLFNTGSSAAQLPTQIQAQRAQIGAQGAQASQLPFQTLNQQQQAANQLSQTQSSQGTALANIMAQLQDKGFATQGGLLQSAAALKNARDVAALQGLFGGGGVGQGAVGGAVNNAIGGIVNPIGNAIGNAITGGLNAIGGSLGNLFSSPQPSLNFGGNFLPNGGLTAEQLNSMSDEDFIGFLLGTNPFGTSEGE